MELRQLRYFLTVAQELNITRAAEAMGYRNDQISFEVKEGTPQIKIRQ